jgi:hypothetical protein
MADDQLALVLNQQLAARMSQPDFMELMQSVSQYEVQSANVRVATDQEYQMAADSLVAVAVVHKALEDMRKDVVAYPNTFTKTVNATFKTLKERCEKTRQRLEYHAGAYKAKKDAEFAKQQAEADAAALQAPAPVTDADSEVKPPEPPAPPLQSTKATNGGSVSFRQGKPKIEVINSVKLIRAALSIKNKVPAGIIQIDAAALRKAVDEGLYKPKQWEKYGVKITQQEEMVVRT